MEINKIYNDDCIQFMQRFDKKVQVVLTSPPYNTSRKGSSLDHINDKVPAENIRYDVFDDCRSNDEYCKWTVDVFNGFDRVLNRGGAFYTT